MLDGNAATVKYEVEFFSFSEYAKDRTRGDVYLDGDVVKSVPPSSISWNDEPGTLTGSTPGTPGRTHEVKASFSWPGDGQTYTVTTNKCPTPKRPGIEIVKDGSSTRYVGDTATFTYRVENTGDVLLTNPVVTDDKCAPVTKVPDGQHSFDPGDVWFYSCTTKITDAMGDRLVNVGKACAWSGQNKVCDSDDHTTEIPKPALTLTKTGVSSAHTGDTVGYAFAVRNTGNVTLALSDIADDKCIDTPVRKAGETDGSFDPDDTFNFTCSYIVPAGAPSVLNTASVCGTYTPPQGSGINPKDVCDTDQHEFPVTTVKTPPPPDTTVTPPPAGGGGVLPERILSGRARLRGPSGCVHRAFRARVSGRSIRSVAFYVDGKLVKKFGQGARYSVKVRPARLGFGRHRVVARVKFARRSGTRTRTLRLTFRRCARQTVTPRFTG